jgi:hypothetical protein
MLRIGTEPPLITSSRHAKATSPLTTDDGREKLPMGGHESAHWWPRFLPGGGHEVAQLFGWLLIRHAWS